VIDVKIQFDKHQQRRLLELLDAKAMAFAEAQALNRTRANVQELALRLVSDDMGIPVSRLKKRGRDVRDSNKKSGKLGAISPGRRASARRLITSLRGFGRPFNVSRWDGAVIREGSAVSLKTGRTKKGKGRAIGTTHKAYGRRQFARDTWMIKSGAIVKRDGSSFEGVYGPGVTQVMEKPVIVRKLSRFAQKRFDHHFKQAVEFAFSSTGQRTVNLRR